MVSQGLARLRAWLPTGRTLPPEVWAVRHRVILTLLWLHALGLALFGLATGYELLHVLAEISVVAAAAALASWPARSERFRATFATFGLLVAASILVHLSGGYIEAHFQFFVVVAIITLYQDWVPFLLAIAYVLLEHGVLGVLEPGAVYNHRDAWQHPWRWAGIHAVFVLGASIAGIVNWRFSELAAADRHAALRARSEIEARFRAALEASLDAFYLLHAVRDAAGRIVDFIIVDLNPRAADLVGRSRGDVIGRRVFELFPEAGDGELLDVYRAVVEDRQPRELEVRVRAAGVRAAWLQQQLVPINGGLAVTARDVTERRQAEERTRQAAARAESLLRTAARLNDELDLERVLRAVCEETARALSAPMVTISLFDPASDTLSVAYWHGLPAGREPRVEPVPRTLIEASLNSAEPVVTPDVRALGELPNAGLYAALDVRTTINLTMRHHGNLVGRLNVGTVGEVRTFTEDELALLRGLADQAAQAIVNARELTERRRAEAALRRADAALRQQTELYQTLLQAQSDLGDGVLIQDGAGRVIYANDALCQITGYAADELRALPSIFELVSPEEWTRVRELGHRRLHGEAIGARYETALRHRSGTRLAVQVEAKVFQADGAARLIAIVRDVTEQKQAEARLRERDEQLRQAQKMEAIGRLAGGIAHDFNNILAVIVGFSELALLDLEVEHPLRRPFMEVLRAGERGAELTRQLLLFSRKGVAQASVLDLNESVISVERMLRRLIGEDIDLECTLATDLGGIRADRVQIEQVLLNLAVNARDAMAQGGRLTITTENVRLEEACDQAAAVPPGNYVLLTVSDTGIGMDAATLERIFEPFFTTKGIGRGTGLGLATVHSIVEQCGGAITVDSEPGLGTTFRIYLPQVDEAVEVVGPSESAAPGGTETLLLVEDEPTLAELARTGLEQRGYTVLEARGGAEALRISGRYDEPIDVLVTDVVMPGIHGHELAERLRRERPELKILFVSGHTDDVVRPDELLRIGAFLQKPYSPSVLARKVREVLDAVPV